MKILTTVALLLAAAPGTTAQPPAPAERTIVSDEAALARLRRNSGVTLQWISWDYRGRVGISGTRLIRMSGAQAERGGAGRLTIEGDVLAIDADSFTFRGRIAIHDTPDAGRDCIRDGVFEFRITQRRRYWRLQQMEACDGLTDYVDIYF